MPDREKIINHFTDAIEASGDGNKWRFVREDILEDAINLLKEIPTIVKCKDCKYWHDPLRCQLDSEGLETTEDWFCADGERRAKRDD